MLESVTFRKGMGKKGIAVGVSNQGKLNIFGQRKDTRLHYLKKHYSEPSRWDNGFPRSEHVAESAMYLLLSQ